MSSNETNELLVKLLAAAEGVPDPFRQYIVHLVTQLSAAAIKERAAAAHEMQTLRRRLPSVQTVKSKSAMMAAFKDFGQERQKVVKTEAEDSNYGRLSPPVFDGREPTLSAGTELKKPTRRQRQLLKGMVRAEEFRANKQAETTHGSFNAQLPVYVHDPQPCPTFASLMGTGDQEMPAPKAQVAGFEHFSQERMNMLQAMPPPDDDHGRLSPPAVILKTAANTEPVGSRRWTQRDSTVTARQQTDDFFAALDKQLAAPVACPSPLSLLASLSGTQKQDDPASAEQVPARKRAASEGTTPEVDAKKVKVDGWIARPSSTQVTPFLSSTSERQPLLRAASAPASVPSAPAVASLAQAAKFFAPNVGLSSIASGFGPSCTQRELPLAECQQTLNAPFALTSTPTVLPRYELAPGTTVRSTTRYAAPPQHQAPGTELVSARGYAAPSLHRQVHNAPFVPAWEQVVPQPHRPMLAATSIPKSERERSPPLPRHVSHARPKCIKCIAEGVHCTSSAHCGNCKSYKCVYIFCNKANCCDASCTMIHRGQYNDAERPRGSPRWQVLGDTVQLPSFNQQMLKTLGQAQRMLGIKGHGTRRHQGSAGA